MLILELLDELLAYYGLAINPLVKKRFLSNSPIGLTVSTDPTVALNEFKLPGRLWALRP